MISKKTRVRSAPSPTGKMQLGNLRTFAMNYFFAKSHGGEFILRIEDTDQKRFVEGGTELIIETLSLYGIEFDEGPTLESMSKEYRIGGDYGPYFQSKRKDIYKKHALKLIEQGDAYYCFCSTKRLEKLREQQEKSKQKSGYDRKCREISLEEAREKIAAGEKPTIRMKLPTDGYTEFEDEIIGKIRANNKEFDDQIILKSDGLPTYHFGVVVDDHLMKITHVFRGREYLTQTPKNVFLYKAFGWEIPKWVHTTLILNPDGKGKLSKRHGSKAAVYYLRMGYLPDAVLNYLMLAGWAPKEKDAHQDEIYTREELIKLFSLDRVKKTNARFDQAKFDYINSKHIHLMDIDQLAQYVFKWAEEIVLAHFISDKFIEKEPDEIELIEQVRKYLPMWKKDADYFKKALSQEHERITKLSEIPKALDFFYDEQLAWDNPENWMTKNHDLNEIAAALKGLLKQLQKLNDDGTLFDHDKWESTVRGYADELGWKHGDMFMALRSAVTGRLKSPPLLESMEIMGWDRAKRLIEKAKERIDNV